jgi:hypothetical protein
MTVAWKNLKIAAAWCRQHWRWLVLSIAFIVVYMLGRKGSKSLKLQAELARKQYLREKEAIQKAHDLEIQKREEAQKRYSDAVVIIEKKHEEDKQNLTYAKKEEVKKMVRKAKEDPEEIDRILEQQLGIKKK